MRRVRRGGAALRPVSLDSVCVSSSVSLPVLAGVRSLHMRSLYMRSLHMRSLYI